MLEDGRSGRRFVDLISLAVGMVLLCCLFVACWLLLQTPDGAHLSADAPASSWSATTSGLDGPVASAAPDARTPPRFEIASLARSRQTLTMACVLLAGLVGGYLQYMRERFSELAAPQLPRGPGGSHAAGGRDGAGALFAFVSQLLMGLGAASVLGLFIPLARAAFR